MFQLSSRSFARDVGSVGRRGSAAVSLPEMLSGWEGRGRYSDTQRETLGKRLSEKLRYSEIPCELVAGPKRGGGGGDVKRGAGQFETGLTSEKIC